MNIYKKILSILVFSFLLMSAAFIYNSSRVLKNNQESNISLFKNEFLELSRELFEKNSNVFFSTIDIVDSTLKGNSVILDYIINTYKTEGSGIIVIDLKTLDIIYGQENVGVNSLYEKNVLRDYVSQYILNQNRELFIDNYDNFKQDTTNQIVPRKIQFKIYEKSGVIVAFGQEFMSAKIRLEFIKRQNESMFKEQIKLSIILITIIIIIIIIFMTYAMRIIVTSPLNSIIKVVRIITSGDFNKRVEIKSGDEIGQLGKAFNDMTEKIQNLYNDMDKKIIEKTAELRENIQDLDRQNQAISNVLREMKENKGENQS